MGETGAPRGAYAAAGRGAYAGGVTEPDLPGGLRRPLLIAAFEGFDDAAGAACGVVEHLERIWQPAPWRTLDDEQYFDFQVNRPQLVTGAGGPRLRWPGVRVVVARPERLERDVVLVTGPEPNLRWRSFAATIGQLCAELGVGRLALLGGLLGDTPHTRPTPVEVTADPSTAAQSGVPAAAHDGPAGMLEVLGHTAADAGLEVFTCWAGVPHYAPAPPCPKASLALLARLEDLLEVPLPLGDLVEEARAWERGVAELTAEDDEVAEYVTDLEQAHDTTTHLDASGEAIASEFQRYLRRREGGGSER